MLQIPQSHQIEVISVADMEMEPHTSLLFFIYIAQTQLIQQKYI